MPRATPAGSMTTRPREVTVDVTRVDQIAIAVEDLDAALALWERAFGLTASRREIVEDDGVEEAVIELGGVRLQLLQPIREDSPVGRFLTRRGPGLHHLGLGVRSVSGALAHLRREDVEVVDEEPRRGGGGDRVAFVHPRGTGGVLVELVEDGGARPSGT